MTQANTNTHLLFPSPKRGIPEQLLKPEVCDLVHCIDMHIVPKEHDFVCQVSFENVEGF